MMGHLVDDLGSLGEDAGVELSFSGLKYAEEAKKFFPCSSRSTTEGALTSHSHGGHKHGTRMYCQYAGCDQKGFLERTIKCDVTNGTQKTNEEAEFKCTGRASRQDFNIITFVFAFLASAASVGLVIYGQLVFGTADVTGPTTRQTSTPRDIRSKCNTTVFFGLGLFCTTWLLASLGATQKQAAPIDTTCGDLSELIKKAEGFDSTDKLFINFLLAPTTEGLDSTAMGESPLKGKFAEESIKHHPCSGVFADENAQSWGFLASHTQSGHEHGQTLACQYAGCAKNGYIQVTSKCDKDTGTRKDNLDDVTFACVGPASVADFNLLTLCFAVFTSAVSVGLCIFGLKSPSVPHKVDDATE
jgi:hypothetical protein